MEMAMQITNSLRNLHRCNFCHWDLKLDNICYDSITDTYYLIDFAFSQRLKRSVPITSFKGNTMFSSIRKFRMTARPHPVDEIESFLYLVCFCLDGFFLPWLQDYVNYPSADEFIEKRMSKTKKSRQYLFDNMPAPISKALSYVFRLNEELFYEENGVPDKQPPIKLN